MEQISLLPLKSMQGLQLSKPDLYAGKYHFLSVFAKSCFAIFGIYLSVVDMTSNQFGLGMVIDEWPVNYPTLTNEIADAFFFHEQ